MNVQADQNSAQWERLDRWMTDNVPGYAGPLEVRAFDAGQSNPTFELATPGRRYVLRRKPMGKLLSSAHAVDREYRVLAALAPTGFPAPVPLALCEDDGVLGSMFYVMEKVEGRILRDPTLPDVPREERRQVYLSMIEVLAKLHSFEPAELGLADFGAEGNYMARQVSRWTKQYRASAAREIPAMDRLIAWLPDTIPAQSEARLVHGDYKPDNVVFRTDAPRLASVLDWELSTIGEPMCDLTYVLMNWAEGPLMDASVRQSLGIPEADELVAEYSRLTGRARPENLDWFMAYNLFRIAAIIEGIVGRAREGTARDPRAMEMAERTPRLADAAWRFAVRAGA